jgi:hypothetical protein
VPPTFVSTGTSREISLVSTFPAQGVFVVTHGRANAAARPAAHFSLPGAGMGPRGNSEGAPASRARAVACTRA